MIESLTARERQVLQLIAAGRTTKEVARELGISFKTAACHRQRVLDKCGAVNTAELVRHAVQKGWISGTAPAPILDRVRRAFEESRKYRQMLRVAVDESRSLRAKCKANCALFRSTRKELRTRCDELLMAVRKTGDADPNSGPPPAVFRAT